MVCDQDMTLIELIQAKPEKMEDALPVINEEIERFSKFMAELDQHISAGPLSNPEKALLRTYLVAKVRGKL